MKGLTLPVAVFGCFAALPSGTPLEPPVIVSASPPFWAVGVNPNQQKSVSLTFDQPMIPAFTDWLGRSSVSPNVDLESSVTTPDRRTFQLKVSLERGKVYVFALNEKQIPGVGFQNDKGLSAPRYYLVFQTTGNVAPQDAPPRVVRSLPQHGATIDPRRVQSLTITFDKAMNVKKHGLHMFENNVPVDLSTVQFAYSPDGMIFTLPYAFKPATQYRFELNDIHDIGFSAASRVPLWPVQIVFSTAQ